MIVRRLLAMSSFALLTLIAFGASQLEAADLTADEVLARHVEAKGGADAWQAVESLRWTGTYGAFGYSSPFTLIRQRPSKLRFDTADKDGAPWIEGHDGEATWTINPFLGTSWAMEMNTVEAAVFTGEADFVSPLFDPASKGYEIQLEGIVDFDGIDSYKLLLTRPDSSKEEWYLDKNTFLEVARIAPAADFGRPIENGRTYFLDFRPVEGLMIPHRIEKEFGTRFRSYDLETVEINPDLDSASFRLPRSSAMAALAPLAGNWNVQVEWERRPGAPWGEAATAAEIEEAFHGALLRTEFSYVRDGQPLTVARTWSYDRFRELYLETSFDNFSFRQNLLEGTMEDGKLVTTSLEPGTFLGIGGQEIHTRQTTHEIGAGGFEILQEVSTDGGETWRENLRMTFRRAEDGP